MKTTHETRGLDKLRHLLALSTSVAAIGLTTAYAQDDTATEDTIVVTGSRIERAGFDTLVPATVLDGDFLQERQYTNAAEALNELPAFGIPGSSAQGDQSGTNVGQNFVNFFGLGSQRTLVVVNGRRFVSSNAPTLGGAAAGLQVDLNVLPSGLIERVETIAVGGAPVYGSDAISGTVNVILKDDFEGIEYSGSYGISDRNDFEENFHTLLLGGNFDDGRGNVTLSYTYNDREGLVENERDHLDVGWQYREPACTNGVPDSTDFTADDCNFRFALVPNAHANIISRGGAVTPGGSLLPNFGVGSWDDNGTPTYLTFTPDGSLRNYDVGTPTGNAVWSVGGEGLFLPDVTNLFTPYERQIATANSRYEINDRIEAFTEFLYANTSATELINQPEYQSGFFGDESQALRFDLTNPFLTQSAIDRLVSLGLDADPTDDTDTSDDFFFLQRGSVDLGEQSITNTSNVWRFVGGFRGDLDLMGRDWNWEVSYAEGNSNIQSRRTDFASDRFFYAVDAVRADDGSIQCRTAVDPSARPTDPAEGFGANIPDNVYDECVPLNLFGEGAPSQEAIDYITGDRVSTSEIRQQIISAFVAGSVFDLPAGPVGFSAGFEHREEGGTFQVGGFVKNGYGREGPAGNSGGNYSTDEVYGELLVPVVSPDMNIPFLRFAEIEGAYRYVDNSLAGIGRAFSYGARVSPVDDIIIRGSFTQSFRAPALTELFLPLSEVGAFAADPCDKGQVDQGPAGAPRRANCIADGIDPDNFTSQVVNASVQGVAGGNLNLNNEVAESYTYGVVLEPRFIPNLSIAADYVNIEIEDAIEQFTLTELMRSCYDAQDFPNDFCNSFVRGPDGQLPATDAFQSGFVNAGLREFEAVTVNVTYNYDLADFTYMGDFLGGNPGQLALNANLYFPITDDETILGTTDEDAGEVGNADFQAQYNLRYTRDALSALVQARYLGEAVFNNLWTDDRQAELGVDGEWLVNTALTYDLTDNLSLRFNVNNVFDNLPSAPVIATGNDIVYDNIGRYYRFGINARF
ncbi:MAG: TonB-dependent receptor [Parvularcula sp.]|nr:TonB-dependent receptor [Parvularcula sp.]